ncbi:MAG: ATP synthase F1 subunit epsilon [Clostridiales bacterium]|nr:ATP synthase F1 subunit epsilon [Clostridiales bacterium]
MATFHLQIVTPDRLVFDGQVERVVARTVGGDVCILARHIDYAAPLGIGEAHIVDENGKEHTAACSGGMLSVDNGEAILMATTFEWAEEIDLARAQRAQQEAEEKLRSLQRDEREYTMAAAKLKRALARIGAAE